MDNHPIPQDVTGFQFRLIGDMTIKQFAYLAAGVILAWIFLASPLFFLIKFPLVVLFGSTGFIFAFIPIGGRPADVMVFHFFKAVFSPTQYTYIGKTQSTTTFSPTSQQPVQKKENIKEEKVHFDSPLPSLPTQPPLSQPPPDQQDKQQNKKEDEQAVEPAPPAKTVNPQELSLEASQLAKALMDAKQEESDAQKGTQEALVAHQKTEELEQELEAIREQKRQLEDQLLALQKQLAQKPQDVFTPSTAVATQQTQNVRKIPPALGKTAGVPFVSDVPNLISGIIKDPRGNVLPNILIEVKDKDGNPVRAFKTNPLGQFASATPVINGTYTIAFEDPNGKQRFDSVEISATGNVLQPLEVISIDAREDLRKELFGG